MPKKKKAGKAKQSGKKSKKVKKKSVQKQIEEQNMVKLAEASAQLWEAKLNVAEQSRQQFRENAKLMMLQNDTLQTQMLQTERDTIDVISYLKSKDQQKDNQLEKVQEELKDVRKARRIEKDNLVEEFSKQVNDLEDKLQAKQKEVDHLSEELKIIRDFRQQRSQMQIELDHIKESMYQANRAHKTTLAQMEQKFFEEKMRLQQEANQKIAELAEKAHSEAIANLDETSKSVYKENVRLSASLHSHTAEVDKLKKRNTQLEQLYKKYKEEREGNEVITKEKTTEAHNLKIRVKELEDKIETVEKCLTHVVHEFDSERLQLVAVTQTETKASRVEIDKLQRIIDLKNKEGNRVKRLAKNILDQRTEVERFFLEALDFVRQQIDINQKQYRQDAKIAYTRKMIEATGRKGDFPKIRTFSKSEKSTNNVYQDIEVANKLQSTDEQVDISDLTWEQKECVLQYLFGRMNGGYKKEQHSLLPPVQKASNTQTFESEDRTFVTNQNIDENMNRLAIIPDITPVPPFKTQ